MTRLEGKLRAGKSGVQKMEDGNGEAKAKCKVKDKGCRDKSEGAHLITLISLFFQCTPKPNPS